MKKIFLTVVSLIAVAVMICSCGGKEAATEKNITVKLDGGDLFIEWPEQKNIFMTGLAQAVFSGEYWGE